MRAPRPGVAKWARRQAAELRATAAELRKQPASGAAWARREEQLARLVSEACRFDGIARRNEGDGQLPTFRAARGR